MSRDTYPEKLQALIDRAGTLTAEETQSLGQLWESDEDLLLPPPSGLGELFFGELDNPLVTNQDLLAAWQRTLDAAGNAGTNNNGGSYFTLIGVATPTVLLVDDYETTSKNAVTVDASGAAAFAGAVEAQRWGGVIDVTPDAVPVISNVPALPGFDFTLDNLSCVPVVSLGLGPVAGYGAARLVMSHYSVMVRGLSQTFVAGPPVVAGVGEEV